MLHSRKVQRLKKNEISHTHGRMKIFLMVENSTNKKKKYIELLLLFDGRTNIVVVVLWVVAYFTLHTT